jgi:RNA polymerase sigma factor (sigma-70 family)
MNTPIEQTSTISSYLSEIGKIAILPKDQQLFHGKRVRRWLDWPGGPDNAPPEVRRSGKRSMDRMTESNLRMVVSIAKKYANQGVPFMDLIQEGNIGLITACHKFDPERGYCFSTFSYWWIRQGITRCLANSSRLIRIPCNTSELARKIRKFQVDFTRQHKRPASPEEVAQHLDIPIERVRLAIDSTLMQPRSLDQLAIDSGSPIGDLIAAESPSSGLDAEESELMSQLVDMLDELPNLERIALEGVAFQRLTHREIANNLQLSTTRVGQLYRLAIQRLKDRIKVEKAAHSAMNWHPADTGVSRGHDPEHLSASAVHEKFENVAYPA